MITAYPSIGNRDMFHELLANPKHIEPGILQSDARKAFPGVVAASHLQVRKRAVNVPASGIFAIIGVATYSPKDLQLLDDVETGHPHWENRLRVAVFDVADCKDAAEVGQLLWEVPRTGSGPLGFLTSACDTTFSTPLSYFGVQPLSEINQTPIVAVYENGPLVAREMGLQKTREVLRRYSIVE